MSLWTFILAPWIMAQLGQDENKKLEETEKKARLIVNERLDLILYDTQDAMAARRSSRTEKEDMEVDDAYVPALSPHPSTLGIPSDVFLADSFLGIGFVPSSRPSAISSTSVSCITRVFSVARIPRSKAWLPNMRNNAEVPKVRWLEVAH